MARLHVGKSINAGENVGLNDEEEDLEVNRKRPFVSYHLKPRVVEEEDHENEDQIE